MTNLTKPLDQVALDALTLSTQEARAAYREQRLNLEVGRSIRLARKQAGLTQTELAARAGIDPGDMSRLETGQGVYAATIGIVERVAQALGQDVVIQFVDAAAKSALAKKLRDQAAVSSS